VDGRTRLDAKKRTLLRDLEQALYDALSESRDVHRALLHLQRAGFSLRLSIECDDRAADTGTATAPNRRSPEVGFRIDADDLRFLRSIGIDPTRKQRARRAPH